MTAFMLHPANQSAPELPARPIPEAQFHEILDRRRNFDRRQPFRRGEAVRFKHGLSNFPPALTTRIVFVFERYLRIWSLNDYRIRRAAPVHGLFRMDAILLLLPDEGFALNTLACDSRQLERYDVSAPDIPTQPNP